jgi:DNA processing protein
LIREGAKLVETADDVMEELGLMRLDLDLSMQPILSGFQAAPADLDDDQRSILDRLTLQPQAVDDLIATGELTASQIGAVLTLLEMRGLARRVPGNAFVRVL